VKNVGRITRTAHLFGFALLLAGCADQQPASPDVGPKLGPAAVGSIIKSSVVTATTLCSPSGKCSTSTRYSEISEKVGRTSALRAAMGISVGGGQSNRASSLQQLPAAALKNIHVSGRTLYADAVNNDGSAAHVEFTGDAVAKGKISAIRLFRNGKPLLAFNAKWKDVGGASYREHTDLTVYHEGQVGLHQEKSFTPRAVLGPDPSDRSAATLTLKPSHDVVICAAMGISVGEGGHTSPNLPQLAAMDDGTGCTSCPYGYDVCMWFQNYTPVGVLGYLFSTLEYVTFAIANWWNGIWGGAPPEDVAALAETVALSMEAVTEPTLYSIAVAIGSAASGGWTMTLIDTLAADMETWIWGLIALE
jgi:hypothetical protein